MFLNKYDIRLISKRENKFIRLLEIIYSSLFTKCDLFIVDVFSGPAFTISNISTFILKKIRKKKLVLVLRGGMLPNFNIKHQSAIRRVLNSADKIITPSLFLKKYFSNQNFKIDYLPNFVSTNIFNSDSENRKQFSVLWVRSFRKIYNPQLAILAFNELLIEFPEATLTMVGSDGGLLDECKQLISDMKITDKVNITGPISNEKLVSYYSTHAVYINTTQYESFGMSVMEAAACKIPIVSTSVGEIPFLWNENKEIMMISQFEPVELAKVIAYLFLNQELGKEMANNAHKKAQDFSWQNIQKKWEVLFSDNDED